MLPVRLDKTIKQLDAVNAKLASNELTGRSRLELLRLQATLGDRRDAALDARRRGPSKPNG
jgi:hypothetical protein